MSFSKKKAILIIAALSLVAVVIIVERPRPVQSQGLLLPEVQNPAVSQLSVISAECSPSEPNSVLMLCRAEMKNVGAGGIQGLSVTWQPYGRGREPLPSQSLALDVAPPAGRGPIRAGEMLPEFRSKPMDVTDVTSVEMTIDFVELDDGTVLGDGDHPTLRAFRDQRTGAHVFKRILQDQFEKGGAKPVLRTLEVEE